MSINNLCNEEYTGEEYARHPNWATPDDWDAHQATIRRLYLDEKRPLKDVVVIMETDYGFRATKFLRTTEDLRRHGTVVGSNAGFRKEDEQYHPLLLYNSDPGVSSRW
ncbi:hypothetical protein F4803DRAFT_546458 [Xylaria telfairii]|nr:hypothetical protein F4803DRAFT_546458 [Xylaria telfairii]